MNIAPLWTSADALRATGGAVTVPWHCDAIASDSRKTGRGDLFIALSGATFNGHDFVAEALAKGAAAALVERRPEGLPVDAPLLIVDDVMAALNCLAAAARARCKGRIIAITGSVGKTSTKQALAQALSAKALGTKASTYAAPASFNNHWGVPLSLAGLPATANYGIFEIGMNHAGEVSALSRLVRPHVALVTTIAAAHLEFFSSLAAVAVAKAEIFDGLVEGGIAVLNRDNPYHGQLTDAARDHTIIDFGVHPRSTLRLVREALDDEGGSGVLERGEEKISYRIGAPGRHWLLIGLAVLAVVSAVGADLHRAARALAEVKPLPGRGQRWVVALDRGSFTLIDESYNANPASMGAAIAVLAGAMPRPGGRRIAVLGDMLELGQEGPAMHHALADDLSRAGIDLVFTVGAQMACLRDALPKAVRAGHGAQSRDLMIAVAAVIQDGDVVMVKGSSGLRMTTIIDALSRIASRPAIHAAGNA